MIAIRSIPPSIRDRSIAVHPGGFKDMKNNVYRERRPVQSGGFKDNVYREQRRGRSSPMPFFKEIKKPVIDIFEEAERIQIIIDLGNFEKSELNFNLKNKSYVISGKHEHCEFKEELSLPDGVDINKMEELFKNNILETVLPKKRQKRSNA